MDLATPETPGSHEHDKPSLKLKSFRKMAKLIKTSQSVSMKNSVIEEDTDNNDDVFEKKEESGKEDEDHSLSKPKRPPPPTSVSPIPPSASESVEQKTRKKRPPPRPNNIVLRQQESQEHQQLHTVSGATPGPSSLGSLGQGSHSSRRSKRHSPRPHSGGEKEQESSKDARPHDSHHSPCRLTTRSQFSRAYMEADDEFFVINYIHICLCGLWLCVANEGGKVLVFDFNTMPQKHQTRVRSVLATFIF